MHITINSSIFVFILYYIPADTTLFIISYTARVLTSTPVQSRRTREAAASIHRTVWCNIPNSMFPRDTLFSGLGGGGFAVDVYSRAMNLTVLFSLMGFNIKRREFFVVLFQRSRSICDQRLYAKGMYICSK